MPAPEQTHYLNPRLLKPRQRKRAQRLVEGLKRLGNALRRRPASKHWSDGTSAFLSFDPDTRRAIVFVHGFGGTGIPTWLNFPALLNGNPKLSSYDLVFYEYDGLQTAADESANDLMNFLDTLFSDSGPLVNSGLRFQPVSEQRPSKWAYEHVVIVAHSLGAIVTRLALIKAQVLRLTWPPNTRFMLFASADPGCHIEQLVSQALIAVPYVGGTPAAVRLLLGLLPLQDVAPNSNTLIQLKTLTERHINRNTTGFLLARRVLRARQDTVITNPVAFFADEEPATDYLPANEPPPGSNVQSGHMAICKPTETFREPLGEVLKVVLAP